MTDLLPPQVNENRRRRLSGYSLLGMISYQLPMVIAFLAKVFGIASYGYTDILYTYFLLLSFSAVALIMIRLRKNISNEFIKFILHFQAISALLILVTYLGYTMADQRHLVPICCLLPFLFVFIQSSLVVSFGYIFLEVIIYIAVSYVGIRISGQPGTFLSEVLYILIYVPVCIFIAYICKIVQDQQKKIKSTNSKLKNAHIELETTYTSLETVHEALESQNERMVESIRYAEMIQRSLLPGLDRLKAVSHDSMFIWMPKDIVGGDIFYTYSSPEGSLIALMDCTGHGVPGAFLTMIVYSEIRKIILDEEVRLPSEILQRLNRAVKTVLHKSEERNDTDDGLDAAVCFIDHANKKVTYAGARIPLFYVKNDLLHRRDGNKQSIGYKNSDEEFIFTDHIIDAGPRCSFYLKTDGFTDQLGGNKNLRFGTRRFTDMIKDHFDKPYNEQRKIIMQTLVDYQGGIEQIDDITLIGFSLGSDYPH